MDGRLEHVARARHVDALALLTRAEHDEGEMDDDVGVGDQGIDGLAIEDVALLVGGLRPAVGIGVEGAPGHADDPLDGGIPFERIDRGDSDLAGRAGDRNGETH